MLLLNILLIDEPKLLPKDAMVSINVDTAFTSVPVMLVPPSIERNSVSLIIFIFPPYLSHFNGRVNPSKNPTIKIAAAIIPPTPHRLRPPP